jgi:hypothetical protein
MGGRLAGVARQAPAHAGEEAARRGASSVIAVSGVRKVFSILRGLSVPGSHIHDHQMRLFMKLRLSKTLPVAAVQAAISVATAYRIEQDPRLPSDKKAPRKRRRPDPLVDIFEAEGVPLLQAAPVSGWWVVFDELRRRL